MKQPLSRGGQCTQTHFGQARLCSLRCVKACIIVWPLLPRPKGALMSQPWVCTLCGTKGTADFSAAAIPCGLPTLNSRLHMSAALTFAFTQDAAHEK